MGRIVMVEERRPKVVRNTFESRERERNNRSCGPVLSGYLT